MEMMFCKWLTVILELFMRKQRYLVKILKIKIKYFNISGDEILGMDEVLNPHLAFSKNINECIKIVS